MDDDIEFCYRKSGFQVLADKLNCNGSGFCYEIDSTAGQESYQVFQKELHWGIYRHL